MSLAPKLAIRGNAKRADQILKVLAKYGLANWVGKIPPELVQKHMKSADGESISEMNRETRIRSAITELGATFIKIGQILSTRADLVGPEVAGELAKLQSNTPADPVDVVRAKVESELGRSIDEIYRSFDPKPLGSASIGQVHGATMPDGREVVVKIQHEGIEETIRRDLEILASLASLAEKRSADLQLYQPVKNVANFGKQLLQELDFEREARNLEQFNRNFSDDPGIRAPMPLRDCSSRRVLTMERLEGTSVAHAEELRGRGVDTARIAERGGDAYMDMIFRDRFYHADPHPGNIFVLPDGETIGFLDFGMIGRVDEVTLEKFEGLLLATLGRNNEELTYYLLQLGDFPPDLDRDAFQSAVSEYIEEYIPANLADADFTIAAGAATDLVREYQIVLDPVYSMLLKVLVTLEGTARILSEDFSLTDLLRRSQPKLVQSRVNPARLLRKAQSRFRDWDNLVGAAPGDIRDILARLRRGTFDVNLEHRRLDRVVNRVVYGVVTAALFLGSVSLWTSGVPPMVGEYSLLGLGGLIGSGVLGFKLLRSIHKSGDL